MASRTMEIEQHGNHGLKGPGPWWFILDAALLALQATLIGLHYQGSPSPFKSRMVVMWIFVLAMFTNFGAALYCARSWLIDSTYSKIIDIVGHISASLASAAFLSLLVPPSSVLVPVIFVLWVLHLPMYVDISRNWILNVVKNLSSRLFSVAVYVLNIWNRCIGNNNEGAPNH